MTQDIKKLMNVLSKGDAMLKKKLENEAFECYRYVMLNIPWDCHDERRALLHRAYVGLCALSQSSDECIWEESSQITGDYRRMTSNN